MSKAQSTVDLFRDLLGSVKRAREVGEPFASWADGWQQQVQDGIQQLSDADLLDAYDRSGGEPGEPQVDVLAAEMQRRGLTA